MADVYAFLIPSDRIIRSKVLCAIENRQAIGLCRLVGPGVGLAQYKSTWTNQIAR